MPQQPLVSEIPNSQNTREVMMKMIYIDHHLEIAISLGILVGFEIYLDKKYDDKNTQHYG